MSQTIENRDNLHFMLIAGAAYQIVHAVSSRKRLSMRTAQAPLTVQLGMELEWHAVTSGISGCSWYLVELLNLKLNVSDIKVRSTSL